MLCCCNCLLTHKWGWIRFSWMRFLWTPRLRVVWRVMDLIEVTSLSFPMSSWISHESPATRINMGNETYHINQIHYAIYSSKTRGVSRLIYKHLSHFLSVNLWDVGSGSFFVVWLRDSGDWNLLFVSALAGSFSLSSMKFNKTFQAVSLAFLYLYCC